MTLQNRVTPLGELIADPARGLVYGNRGCLHDGHGQVRRSFTGLRWIACRLEFKGWQRGPKMQPGRFTELFFLDEATAMAAGHRPCALCRRADYTRFCELLGETGADQMDRRLHAERFDPATRAQRHHRAPVGSLPDGTLVLHPGGPRLVLGHHLLRWSPAGYDDPLARPRTGAATVITPPAMVAVLGHGWDPVVPLLHPSAGEYL